jgi:hypothetical protein
MTGNPMYGWTMRQTSDLVKEMLEEAKKAWLVAIVVGFENETKFVFSNALRPLIDLNNLIKSGGAPIGLLRFENTNTGVQGLYRPFEEYENEEWVKNYLAGLLDHGEEIIAESRHPLIIPAAS